MKKITICFIALLFSTYCLSQAPAVEWQKSYGGTNNDYANCIKQTPDGGYIVAGAAASNDGDVIGFWGTYDCWILKLDSSGNIEWQRTYGGNGNESVHEILLTDDGGYLVAAQSDYNEQEVTAPIHGESDLWIVKLDAQGDIEWQKALGGSNQEFIRSIVKATDGGYVIAALTFSNDGDVTTAFAEANCWIVKINATGNIQWQKTFGGSGYDMPNSLAATADGGYIFAADSNSNDGDVSGNHGDSDWWIVKIDAVGNLQWQKTFGGTNGESASSIAQCEDGGYIVGGNTQSLDGDVVDNTLMLNSWILKLSNTGAIDWQRTLGDTGCQNGVYLQETNQGGFIVAGAKYSNDPNDPEGFGNEDIYLGKLNASGNLLWHRILGTSGADFGRDVVETNDNGYIVAGSTNSDLWLAKIGADILSVDEINKQQPAVYPNPAKNTINIISDATISQVAIVDITGKTVAQFSSGSNLNIEKLSSGMYFINAVSEGKKIKTKFIKQ